MERKYWNDKSINVKEIGIVEEGIINTVLWQDINGTYYCDTDDGGSNTIMRLNATTCEEAVEECKEYLKELIKGWEE